LELVSKIMRLRWWLSTTIDRRRVRVLSGCAVAASMRKGKRVRSTRCCASQRDCTRLCSLQRGCYFVSSSALSAIRFRDDRALRGASPRIGCKRRPPSAEIVRPSSQKTLSGRAIRARFESPLAQRRERFGIVHVYRARAIRSSRVRSADSVADDPIESSSHLKF
jgi:hypothetical protein